ncbi:hypothetical protein ACM26V_03100 [Salipaludibacillus sp. HK11]
MEVRMKFYNVLGLSIALLEDGQEFNYSNAGFCIMQQLIEDVTGKTF